MKLLILLLFVGIAMAAPEAKPEAEADADALFYGYYGYARPYAHYGYYGYPGYSRYYGYGGYYGYPYTYGHGYYWGKREAAQEEARVAPTEVEAIVAAKRSERDAPEALAKRDAEAEPEADPYYLYSSYYGHHPYTYGYYGGLSHYYAPYTYTTPYAYYANSGGAIHAVGKRSAEPEPEANPDAHYPYYGWGGWGRYYGYRRPYWGRYYGYW